MDVPARVVSGLTSSAKALFVAAAAQAQPHGVVLYVLPGDGDLEEACADVSFFLGALEGLTPASTERVVLPFPSHEVDPYRGMAPHMGLAAGLVVEMGGTLSHGAIIAREYGLPAIANVHGVTCLLKDGERVAVDATAGVVNRFT